MIPRDGKADDLPGVMALTLPINGLAPEEMEQLISFYLESGMPVFFRVVDGPDGVASSLAAVLFQGDVVVLIFIAVEGERWGPILMWRQLERWARAQRATAIVTSTPAEDLPLPRFLRAAGLTAAGPAASRQPGEVWMRKEL